MSHKLSKISPKDIINFIEGNVNYYLNRDSTPNHVKEQILYRMLLCPDCAISNRCLTCGCSSPHLFFAPNKVDALHR